MKTKVLLSHRARRIFFFIHLWIGLTLGGWFALIGLTGSVLTWRGELSGIELARQYPIEKPSVPRASISVTEAVAAMKKAHPDAKPKELAAVTLPHSRMPFYTFSRGESRAKSQTYAVDPYSGKVHPPVRMNQFFGAQIQQFHQRLFLGAKGFVTNGFLTAISIFLVLSGLWLWWPTKLKHLKAHLTLKRGVSLKRTLHDLHNILGIYLYVVLLVTTVTGAMLAFQRIGNEGGVAAFIAQEKEERSATGPGGQTPGRTRKKELEKQEKKEITVEPAGQPINTDSLIQMGRALYPRYELRRIKLPLRPTQPLEMSFAKPYGFEQDETLLLNPYTGQQVVVPPEQVEKRRSPARQWAHDLHLGEFGGLFSKLIYTLSGLTPLGLFVTGVLMWWRKKRLKTKSSSHRSVN